MKMKSTLCTLAMMLTVFAATWTFGQDANSDSKSKSDARTITGCLAKGDGANEYLLTANDGSTWELRSDSAPLAEHVGQTVSATGAVKNATAHNLKEDAKDAAADAHMKKNRAEHGHMTVTSVEKVSDSCQK